MALDLSTEQFIRAGGSFLLALVGVAAIALSKRRVAGLALGLLLACQGLAWTGNNLFQGNVAIGRVWFPLQSLIFAGAGVAWLLLMRRWPAALRPHERSLLWMAMAVGAAVALLFGTYILYVPGGWATYHTGSVVPSPGIAWTQVDYVVASFRVFGFVSLCVLLPLRYAATTAVEQSLRRRLAFGGFFFNILPLGVGAWLLQTGHGPGGLSLYDVDGLGPSVGAALWLRAAAKQDGGLAVRVALGILALALVGMLLQAWWPEDVDDHVMDAAVGISRCVWAFAFAYGIARLGLFGHDIKLRTARRGTLAAGALALLFIVAQVAQNFFSAQYGLLTGGIVAGTFLFAANPIQKRIEGMGEGKSRRSRPAGAGAEESYRAALRFALKDKRLTKEEERSLLVLAHDLGIAPARAFELRDELEGAKT